MFSVRIGVGGSAPLVSEFVLDPEYLRDRRLLGLLRLVVVLESIANYSALLRDVVKDTDFLRLYLALL